MPSEAASILGRDFGRWRSCRTTFVSAESCCSGHHCIGLFPKALRAELGLNPSTTLMSIGMQVASYRQLKDAIAFLKSKELRFIDTIPFELHPGIDYAAHVIMPDGHCIQLYHAMEQVGWDGKPRPASQR